VLCLLSSLNLRSAALFFPFIQIDQSQDVAIVLGGVTRPDGSRTTIQFSGVFPQRWTASLCSSFALWFYSGALARWFGDAPSPGFRFTEGDGGVVDVFTWWGLEVAKRLACLWLW
jgi:hypothetical protein